MLKRTRHTKFIESFFLIIVIVIASCTFVACYNNDTSNEGNNVYENTILMYMCGSDLESDWGSCTDNITELLSSDIPNNTAVIIETGGTKKWRQYDIDNNAICRYIVKDNALKLVEKLPNASMGDAGTLSDFIKFGFDNYRADKMGLVLWDHGGGGLKGVCFDENYLYDGLSLDELERALSVATTLYKEKFDLVGFDACLMSDIETIGRVKDYANYIIASEELEPIGGWDYSNIVANFGSEAGYKKVLKDYEAKCIANAVDYYVLSLIDCKNFDKVEKSFDVFTTNLMEIDLGNIARKAQQSVSLGEVYYREQKKDLIDLGDFAGSLYFDELAGEIPLCVDVVKSNLRKDATGISIFYPQHSIDSNVKEYLAISNNANYKKFLRDNYTSIPKDTVKFVDKGKVDNNSTFSVAVDPSTFKYVKSIQYKLYELDVTFRPEGGIEDYVFYSLGGDSDVSVDDITGKIVPNINCKWACWRGEFINCIVCYRDEDVAFFETPVKKNGVQGTVRFTYEKATKTFKMLGFVPLTDKNMSSRLQQVLPTDTITLLYDDRSVYDNGELKEGKSFVMGDNFDMSVAQANEAMYNVYVEIIDIYGNVFRSDTATYVAGYDDNNEWSIHILTSVDEEFSDIFK